VRGNRCNNEAFTSGVKIGPPQLREYPVDPVGVEIINRQPNTNSDTPRLNTSIVIIEVVSFLLTVISFMAKLIASMDSLGVQVKLSKVRLEIVYFLSITNCMNEAMFFVPKLKPNLPALIPKMGIPESRTKVAALRWFRHHLY
jgi:hypothetical protein